MYFTRVCVCEPIAKGLIEGWRTHARIEFVGNSPTPLNRVRAGRRRRWSRSWKVAVLAGEGASSVAGERRAHTHKRAQPAAAASGSFFNDSSGTAGSVCCRELVAFGRLRVLSVVARVSTVPPFRVRPICVPSLLPILLIFSIWFFSSDTFTTVLPSLCVAAAVKT